MVKHAKQIKLSPSRLSLFKACKRCFWLSVVKGMKYPGMPFPSLPGGMDSVLKKYFDDCRVRKVMPSEIKGKLKGKLFDDEEKVNNLAEIETIQSQLKKEKPDKSIFRTAWNALENNLPTVSGIVSIMEQIKPLIEGFI